MYIHVTLMNPDTETESDVISLPDVNRCEIESAMIAIGVMDWNGEERGEYIISDVQTDVPGLKIDAMDDIMWLNHYVEELTEHDDADIRKAGCIMEHFGMDLEEALDCLDEFEVMEDPVFHRLVPIAG